MAWWMAIPAIAQAGYGIGQKAGLWGQQPKQPKAADRPLLPAEYMKELERRKDEGILTGEQLDKVTQRATKPLMGVAREQTSAVRGELIRGGLAGSPVIGEAISRANAKVTQQIAEIAEDIAFRNEMTKTGATDKFFQAQFQDRGIQAENQYQQSLVDYQNQVAAFQTQQSGLQNILSGAGSAISAYSASLPDIDIDKMTGTLETEGILSYVDTGQGGITEPMIINQNNFYEWLMQFDQEEANRIEDYYIQIGALG